MMSKLDSKTQNIAQKLMEKHDKEKVFVKVKNGQMYFNETSARYGLSEEEFEENIVCVKRKTKAKKKAEDASKPDPDNEDTPQTQGDGDDTDPDAEKLGKLRAEYKELAGKNFFPGWTIEQLEQKIAELKESKG